jgi:hypothetical protein
MERILAIPSRVQTAAFALGVIAARIGEGRIAVLHLRLTQGPAFMPAEAVMPPERLRDFDHASRLREIYETWRISLPNAVSARWIEIIGHPAHDRQEVGGALVDRAKTERPDLLVTRAFTHGRFVEMLLGGTTRVVLAKAAMSLLMHNSCSARRSRRHGRSRAGWKYD